MTLHFSTQRELFIWDLIYVARKTAHKVPPGPTPDLPASDQIGFQPKNAAGWDKVQPNQRKALRINVRQGHGIGRACERRIELSDRRRCQGCSDITKDGLSSRQFKTEDTLRLCHALEEPMRGGAESLYKRSFR
ncbi:hypothetical protein mvi_64950 (plasmid) [Methylobacterium indicum]|uniref:Uncharacterized protein n=1 Tax=Methylobacterium indicum TaxID=1775910 RepID=A0A8H8X0X3_9HYPH|nr:hypothetical protein mvi_64950 [Methylobacterium indicum]